jgi:hypothetical protein
MIKLADFVWHTPYQKITPGLATPGYLDRPTRGQIRR